MNKQYRIYLDVCCFNRPFDDQTQWRISLETKEKKMTPIELYRKGFQALVYA